MPSDTAQPLRLDRALFRLLQHGDSQFPSGALAFSWGLEGLKDKVTRRTFPRFLEGQIRHRWQSFDRVFTAHAWHTAGAGEVAALAALDDMLEAATPVALQRAGSRRAGGALLSTHQRLGTPGAASYRTRVSEGRAIGHLAVVQGLVWRRLDFSETESLTLAAYGLTAGLSAAAIRLSIIGHIDAQNALSALAPIVDAAIAAPLPPPAEATSFAPQCDLAMMNHGNSGLSLFAN